MKSRSELKAEIKSMPMIPEDEILELIIKLAREGHIEKDAMLANIIEMRDEKTKIEEDIKSLETD